MARAEHGARFSAAPAARPAPAARIAQPNISHGAPMNAHAQMPAPRAAAPAMPQPAAVRGSVAALPLHRMSRLPPAAEARAGITE